MFSFRNVLVLIIILLCPIFAQSFCLFNCEPQPKLEEKLPPPIINYTVTDFFQIITSFIFIKLTLLFFYILNLTGNSYIIITIGCIQLVLFIGILFRCLKGRPSRLNPTVAPHHTDVRTYNFMATGRDMAGPLQGRNNIRTILGNTTNLVKPPTEFDETGDIKTWFRKLEVFLENQAPPELWFGITTSWISDKCLSVIDIEFLKNFFKQKHDKNNRNYNNNQPNISYSTHGYNTCVPHHATDNKIIPYNSFVTLQYLTLPLIYPFPQQNSFSNPTYSHGTPTSANFTHNIPRNNDNKVNSRLKGFKRKKKKNMKIKVILIDNYLLSLKTINY